MSNQAYTGLLEFIKNEQPVNTYSYCLNGVAEEVGFITNEESNFDVAEIPENYTIIGSVKIERNSYILFLCSSDTSLIGKFENNQFTELISSKNLNFKKTNYISAVFRKRINNERIIYWVDGYNLPRSINIDNLEYYYNNAYINWLESSGYNRDSIINSIINTIINNDFVSLSDNEKITFIYENIFNREPDTEGFNYWISIKPYLTDQELVFEMLLGAQNEDLITLNNYINNIQINNIFSEDKWDVKKFNLIKSYSKIPKFESIEIIDNGSISAGSYNFAIQYLDENLNSTNWITTSNTVNIYNSQINNEYYSIRGSRNIESALMSYSVTNKAIKVITSNFDEEYPYYRLAIIQANNMTGIPNKALVSEIKSINDSVYIYSGNNESLSEISISEIEIDKEYINAVECIEQLENRLILASGSALDINFANFQKYASKISSHLSTKKIYLNSIAGEGNCKDPITPFNSIGYMPGEVYSFGIVYVIMKIVILIIQKFISK